MNALFHQPGPFAISVLLALLTACSGRGPERLQGYIEGEFLQVASPMPGTLEKLAVARGAQVKPGELLYLLDSAPEKAARDEAARRLAQARHSVDDARKGKRPSELASLEAQFKLAQSVLAWAEEELRRQQKLMETPGATTAQELDRARSARDQDRQRVAQLEAEVETARLGARSDQVAAAEANVRALEAALAKADWDLAQTRQTAPQGGVIFDTVYREGEWVAAGRPVVVLLPPQNVKLRVFAPEPWLGAIHLGDPVRVFIDGASQPVAGKISFISPRAEFTPPVIYSRRNRAKFVFLVEAVFEPGLARQLHPGQPVDVEFNLAAKR